MEIEFVFENEAIVIHAIDFSEKEDWIMCVINESEEVYFVNKNKLLYYRIKEEENK